MDQLNEFVMRKALSDGKHILKKLVLRIFLPLALAVGPAAAHSPVLDPSARTEDSPFLIEEPEHSKAIFSELDGTPHFYEINSNKPFDFYVGITAPKIEDCSLDRTFSFDILDAQGKRIDGRDGQSFEWWPWYEEWGETWYWIGPEIGKEFKATERYPAGTYFIKVFNPENRGQYVLAVGDEERFGLSFFLSVWRDMNTIRRQFWDEQSCN